MTKTCSKCGEKIDATFTLCLKCGANLPDSNVDELVAEWFKGYVLTDAAHDEPEIAWQAILKILSHELTGEQLANLAAGPMESLLSWHGPNFIERVETEAGLNPRFNYMLGGVWECEQTADVWERVQKARKQVW